MEVEYLSENEEIIEVESPKKVKKPEVKPVLKMNEYSVINQKAPPLRDRSELLKVYKGIGDMIESVAKKV